MKFRSLIFILILFSASFGAGKDCLFTAGPFIHFGGPFNTDGVSLKELNWGIEFSYWHRLREKYNYFPAAPFKSIDVGVEFRQDRRIIYSELQIMPPVGIDFAEIWGWSLGFSVDLSDKGIENHALQVTTWTPVVFGWSGLYYRLRFILPEGDRLLRPEWFIGGFAKAYLYTDPAQW
ncbi:MAG: hypothetical protein ACLFQK_10185 [Fibrobacterota bacterium]